MYILSLQNYPSVKPDHICNNPYLSTYYLDPALFFKEEEEEWEGDLHELLLRLVNIK